MKGCIWKKKKKKEKKKKLDLENLCYQLAKQFIADYSSNLCYYWLQKIKEEYKQFCYKNVSQHFITILFTYLHSCDFFSNANNIHN